MIPQAIQSLLAREEVTDLCINRYDQIYIDVGRGMELHPEPSGFQNENDFRTFILEQISLSGKTWDAKLPFLDTVFFQTHRAHISFPPLAQFGIYLSLRRLPKRSAMTSAEAQAQSLVRWNDSHKAFHILQQAITQHETMIIAGGTGSVRPPY